MIFRRCVALPVVVLGTSSAAAQPDDYGIDFVTIGDVGNTGYDRMDPNNFATGRGAVDHEYRIGRLEITTGQ